MTPRERDIMSCLVRYPEQAGVISDMGAEPLLKCAFARNLWKKIMLRQTKRPVMDCRELNAPSGTAAGGWRPPHERGRMPNCRL